MNTFPHYHNGKLVAVHSIPYTLKPKAKTLKQIINQHKNARRDSRLVQILATR